MEDLIIKLALGKTVTDLEIEQELYTICEREHSSCNNDCPVYMMNGSKIPQTDGDPDARRWGCDCFRDGEKMLQFIRHKNITNGKK